MLKITGLAIVSNPTVWAFSNALLMPMDLEDGDDDGLGVF